MTTTTTHTNTHTQQKSRIKMTTPLEEVNKAYEDAVSAERQRRESLEAQEVEMDADALHRRLKGKPKRGTNANQDNRDRSW